ncbi:MAG: hypothetical protein AAFQ62_15685 [Pseudomonadota bacterium]
MSSLGLIGVAAVALTAVALVLWANGDARESANADPEEVIAFARTVAEQASGETVVAYLLANSDREPSDDDINRTTGAPIGVTEARWPRIGGKKMAHAITLDVSRMPEVAERLSPGTVAVALFLSDLWYYEAYEPLSPDAVVLELTAKDLATGVNLNTPKPSEEDPPLTSKATTFTAHRIDIPKELFEDQFVRGANTDLMDKLSGMVLRFGIAGAKPFWIQGEEYDRPIILQFNEYLADMSFSDGGSIYVFQDTAFMQSS